MTSKGLTVEQVAAYGRAAVDNALSIMQEAVILMGTDRPLRAYALGVIAAEEFAKHLIVRDALDAWDGTLTIHEFTKKWITKDHSRRHERLLEHLWGMAPGTPLPSGWPSLTDITRNDEKARGRCLYVGMTNAGQIQRPEDVDADQARQYVRVMADMLVRLASPAYAGIDAAAARARQQRTPD